MSFGGILAQALAGATGAIGKQAGDDIEGQRKADLMRQEADIREQAEKRLIEFRANSERIANKNKLIDTRDFNADDATISASDKIARATGATNRGILKETLADDGLNEAQRKKADADARAKADTDKAITKEQAADPIYLGAVAKIKLADPEVAARIAASRASAGASAASAAESRERTEGLKLGNADKRKLDGLYGEARTILADASISDEERAKRYGKVQTQILLMKSKSGQGSTRDPELDTQTVTEEKINPDGTTTKVVRKEVRRPGQGGAATKPTEQQAHAEAEAAIKNGGASRDAVNSRLVQLGYKPLGGAGDKPGMAPGAERAARTKPAPDYRPASDGSGRMVDVTTGRTLTPEQSAILQKMQRGEPTTPRERAMLAD